MTRNIENVNNINNNNNNGITIVIPCLNEERSIGLVVDQARLGINKSGLPGEIVVVDNGSGDQSAKIATMHGARVIHESHRGYGSALRKGFSVARFNIIIMGDADLTYDFTRINELIEPILINKADLVIGNRMRNIKSGAMPWLHRYIGNPILTFCLRLMFRNSKIKDAHCGLRAIIKSSYIKLQCVTTGMEFASEMIINAIRHKLNIAQVDIIYHQRTGESKLRSFRDGWRHLRFMILHSPSAMLLIPGITFWLLGLVLTLRLSFGKVFWNERAFDIHTMIMGGVLNIISLQLIISGILAKAYAHLSGLRDDRFIAWLYRNFTFEKSILYITLFFLIGLALTIWVVIKWIASGFGPLNEAFVLFFSTNCLINAVQLATTSYLFSIMSLPRHIDIMPEHSRETGISDL